MVPSTMVSEIYLCRSLIGVNEVPSYEPTYRPVEITMRMEMHTVGKWPASTYLTLVSASALTWPPILLHNDHNVAPYAGASIGETLGENIYAR